MSSPVVLPELGTTSELHVSSWLVDLGDQVHSGDRIVEVLMPGITFQVAATATGILTGIAKPEQSTVRPGDTLGWIEPDEPGDDQPQEETE